ncbi:MAG: Spi family protease inhibitor, partial [Bacteroidota bacterium]|nr:Spi family protease inhibitor [Bacteroidota bacterium]
MRKIIYLLLLSMTTYIASSQTVNLGSAKKIAENYYHAYSKSPNKSNNVEATLLKSEINNNDTLYYIFNIGNEGFVIVSGEFTKSPVLGYSDEGTIDLNNMSPEFKYWLDGYATQIANVKKVNKAEKKLSSVNIDSYINKLKQKSGEPTSRGISQLLKT